MTGLASLNGAPWYRQAPLPTASTVKNNATVGGTLGVTGATTTNGITNTGNVDTDTLSTTGLATLNSVGVTNNATVGGTLGVSGRPACNAGDGGTGTLPPPSLIGDQQRHRRRHAGRDRCDHHERHHEYRQYRYRHAQHHWISDAELGERDQQRHRRRHAGRQRTGPPRRRGEREEPAAVAAATNVDMGGNRVQNVGAPVDSTDAATKGYVDTFMGTTSSEFATLNDRVNEAFKKIDGNTEGIAVAMAMSGLALPDSKAFAMSATMGFYDDKQALSAQAAMRLNRTFALTGGVGVGLGRAKWAEVSASWQRGDLLVVADNSGRTSDCSLHLWRDVRMTKELVGALASLSSQASASP